VYITEHVFQRMILILMMSKGCFSTGAEVDGGDTMCEGVGRCVVGDPVSGVGVAVG
jgi:hypothetical protein